MTPMNMEKKISKTLVLVALMMAVTLFITPAAKAASPGITASDGNFRLVASPAYISQPDGSYVYSWGYGCAADFTPTFLPANINAQPVGCPTMQLPGPTLIVTQGQTVTVTLTNSLPKAAGNTSILFPGFNVTSTGGVPGLLTQEAIPGGAVTYSFTATTPGTRAYYSGTQGDLQVEMGLYGTIIVLPSTIPAVCDSGIHAQNLLAQAHWGESDYRLAHAAYNHAEACYDREYLFQFSEMDPRIHQEAEQQANNLTCTGCMTVATEPYVPAYFMINGRSMPDLMDANYDQQYPHQPYNGDPHMHPGELTLVRIVGQNRWQHPFHEHGNHLRILARDGNLILSQTSPDDLAGPLLFTTTTTPGLAMDAIYYWTGKGLNWDPYGHHASFTDGNGVLHAGQDPGCQPDANGYNTLPGTETQINYFEWCQDHDKPLEVAPFGDVGAGGPATLPNPNILANGAWYGGSPYLGPDATVRAVGATGTTPPSGTVANSPSDEAGFAFMWHSHNEREITTNNIFPGGMLMMMLVDSREFVIDETR